MPDRHAHQWAKLTFTPVEVLEDDAGNPVVMVDPDAQAFSDQEGTQYGCLICHEPLATHWKTICLGPSS